MDGSVDFSNALDELRIAHHLCDNIQLLVFTD